MKIVFIIGSISDSHIIKRVKTFADAGYSVDVYGFQRGVNTANQFEGIPLTIIGQMEDQHYHARLKKEWNTVSDVIRSQPKGTLFYVWGFDLALICKIHKCTYIYEISDMVHSKLRWPLNKVLRGIDKRLIAGSEATLITSEGFIEYLGYANGENSKFILMPNKLSESFDDIERPNSVISNNKVRFGFVGYYRYPNTVMRLARVIGESYPNMEFHFWGTGPDSMMGIVNDLVKKHKNIIEHGRFKNPDDLDRVYSSFDIVACNYDATGPNERIAEPNKLYEALFYNKPILVSRNTFLGTKVERMGVGYVIDTSNDENIKEFLGNLNYDELKQKAEIEKQIPSRELVEDYSEVWKLFKNGERN